MKTLLKIIMSLDKLVPLALVLIKLNVRSTYVIIQL